MSNACESLHFNYSPEKNSFLKQTRGVSFEEVELAIVEENNVLDIISHPNQAKYPNQRIYVLNIDNYVYLVPFVAQGENEIFLKTIFPSRKLTKKYLLDARTESLYEKNQTKTNKSKKSRKPIS